MEETQNNGNDASTNDLLGNGIGDGNQNLTTTDADVTDFSTGGDLGGGRVGGDLGESVHPGSGAEDEDLVTYAVNDGSDIAAPDDARGA